MAQNLTCLESTVGLLGLCEDQDTILYVNDLPGVEFRSFAAVATQQDLTGKNAFERIRRVAARQVNLDFLSHLKKRKNITLLSVVSSRESGGFHREDYYESEEVFVGKEFYTNSDGQLIRQRVDWVEVKARTEHVATIYIEADGVTYHKENYTLRQGINRIPIELKGGVIRVYLSLDGLELSKQYSSFCACGSLSSCRCENNGCGYEKTITSADGKAWQSGSIDPFRYRVSCVCDRSEIACNYREELAEPMWYKTGALSMEEIVYGDGKSYFLRNSKANAERWIASISGGEDPETGFKQESKYWRSIAQATNSIVESLKNTPCVACEGLTVTDSIP